MQNNNQETQLHAINTNDHISISQEETRKWLAKFITICFFLLIVFVAVLSIYFHDKSYYFVFDTTITGLIGILGAITGFYFGGKH